MIPMEKIRVIIDSNYLCYISKYALSNGLSYNGGRTEIIFGFLKDIISLAKKFETNNFVFCWDSKESERRKIFSNYKYKRHQDKTEDEIVGDKVAFRQFTILREKVLPYLGFSNVFFQEGYEADDLIASVVMNNKDMTNIVVSSDNDLYQLLEYCSLYNFSKQETMTELLFNRNFGIQPHRWVDVKTLAGCSSDNVPGIEGVGEIKAIKYLKGELSSGKTFDSIKAQTEDEKELTERLVKLPFPGTKIFEIKKNHFSIKTFNNICDEFGFISLKDKNPWQRYFVR